MSISKKMTLSNIKQIHSKTFTQKKIIVSAEGKDFEVLIAEHFKPIVLQEMIMEMAEDYKYLTSITEILDIPSYFSLLLLKHFTNIEACQEAKTFADKVSVFNILLDLDIPNQITQHWDEKELKKINEYMKRASKNIKELENNPELLQELAEVMAKADKLDKVHNELETVLEENDEKQDVNVTISESEEV